MINKGGRPIKKLTPEQVAQVSALARYLSKGQIADFLGIARSTFDAILDRDEEVFIQYKKGRAQAIANVAKGLVQQAIEGNTTAAIFYLKTQAGWRETDEQESINMSNTQPIIVNVGIQDASKPSTE